MALPLSTPPSRLSSVIPEHLRKIMNQFSPKVDVQTATVCVMLIAGSSVAAAAISRYLRHRRRRPTCRRLDGEHVFLGHTSYYFKKGQYAKTQRTLDIYRDAMKIPFEHQHEPRDEDDVSSLEEQKASAPRTLCAWIPALPYLVVTADEANVKHILKDRQANYPKGQYFRKTMHDLLGDGIFNSDFHTWKRERHVAVRGMTLKNLETFIYPMLCEHASEIAHRILSSYAERGMSFDIFRLMNKYTLESIGVAGFGTRIGCLEDDDSPFLEAFDKAQLLTEKRFWDPRPLWLMKAMRAESEMELKDCVALLRGYSASIVEQRRQVLFDRESDKSLMALIQEKSMNTSRPRSGDTASSASTCGESPAICAAPDPEISITQASLPASGCPFANMMDDGPQDFLSMYLLHRPDATDNECADFLLNFLIAGRDTTAQALSWCWYELLKHPEVIETILEEIHETRTVRNDGLDYSSPLAFQTIRTGLPLLTATLYETLRLHPSVPWDPKEAAEDDVLPDGTKISKGTIVMYSAFLMGRDPRRWGNDAAAFRPSRWIEMETLPSPYAYPVFQAGPRECLGKHMALLEMKTLMVEVLPRFILRPLSVHDFSKIEFAQSVTLPMDRPFNVSISHRN